MKQLFAVLVLFAILISGCIPSSSATLPENTPTTTVTKVPSTATATETPVTPTFTPSPTLALPVAQLTPVPVSSTKISAENVKSLQEIARYEPAIYELKAYRQEYYFGFLNDDVLSFKNFDAETLDNHSCDLSLANGSLECQSHAPQLNKGRYLGKDVILATDGMYYGYTVGDNTVDIYPVDNPGQVYYSIPFRHYTFDLLSLDPVNKLVIYNIALSGSINRVIIQDMQNDQVLEKWEGETFVSSIVISENQKHAAICRTIGYTNRPNKDRLIIFDLSEKRTVYQTEFTCSATALGMSSDGSKLAVQHYYFSNPTTRLSRILILDIAPPNEKQNIDFDSWFFPYAVAYSPNNALLAARCNENDICFLDSSNYEQVFTLKTGPGITNLAFSPDGSLFATSSNSGLISIWAVPPFGERLSQGQPSPLSIHSTSLSWDFDQDDNLEGWGEEDWQIDGLNNLTVKDGYLSAVVTGPSTRLNNADEHLGIDASKFSEIELRMKVSAGIYGVVYFTHNDGRWSEHKGKYFDLIPDNEFHTYLIDMNDVVYWAGIIDQLRVDPVSDAAGTTITIDYIHLLP